MLADLLGSIPSPSSGQLQIGPLRLTAYGLMIALGVVAAVEIARRRHAHRGGDPDDFSSIAVWAVIAGLIGARIYHVLTDLERFRGNWGDVIAVWKGGLGIPGGLLAGVLVGLWAARRRGLSLPYAMDMAAPAIPVAQAIGRFGNWWNQELFGGPTSLPWGLEIDPDHRPVGYENEATYHPTFLYEALWNVGLALFIVWLERRTRDRLRPGSMFAIYVAGYGVGRFWVESLRIDPAQQLFGMRFNLLLAAVTALIAVGWLVLFGLRRPDVGLGQLEGEPLDVREWAADEADGGAATDRPQPLDEAVAAEGAAESQAGPTES
ncbi:MAG: prolipoprotein diacylglyceryl transferase [Acidimicrobiia bacterium]